jgi:hypothetical protein
MGQSKTDFRFGAITGLTPSGRRKGPIPQSGAAPAQTTAQINAMGSAASASAGSHLRERPIHISVPVRPMLNPCAFLGKKKKGRPVYITSEADGRPVDVKVPSLSRSDGAVKLGLDDDQQLIAVAHNSVQHLSSIRVSDWSINICMSAA